MNDGRANHSIAKLPDGKILVAGGESYRGTSLHPKASCEILNIETLQWENAAPMNNPRINHEAVTLKDGKVLTVLGFYEMGQPQRIVTEIYTPKSNDWGNTGNLISYPGYFHYTPILLDDGSVLVIGLYSIADSEYTACNRFFYDPTGIENPNKKIQFNVAQNYPNPFNPTTTIEYSIPEQTNVTLKIFDLLGREVITLVNEEKPAGNYKVEFSASSGSTSLPSGIYFYRLEVIGFIDTKKLILIK
jgi:hypothetical protein